jgi:hydrogenase maturation protein HypF
MRSSRSAPGAMVRVRLDITGVVQGVGFRPAVARIAMAHGVSGFVFNDAGCVHCELEGTAAEVDAAASAIRHTPPPMARIDGIHRTQLKPLGDNGSGGHRFEIVASVTGDTARTLIPPDIATCTDCLRELRDPDDRRFGHPFITCTNCGPRYTVITDLPYDRPATTMAAFGMCPACAAEYRDPTDRRFHAQTIACPNCGPTLSWSGPGRGDPLAAAAAAIDGGGIVAIKGVGGYHLACRADDAGAVAELRRRKDRPAKPFAVMVADLDAARRAAEVSVAAAALLSSASAPIVLLPARAGTACGVAPGLADIGIMLAYSPVHQLLFDRIGATALVMTSANQGGSPIVFRDNDLGWIDGLADGVLTHDRPIQVSCEDSVVAVAGDGAAVPIRRSRGYAPLPVTVQLRASDVILATGGDVKTTFCLMAPDGQAHMSSHLGDMADPRTQSCFDSALAHLASMTDRSPGVIACDLHPSYATTRWAQRSGSDLVRVQHHHAHAVSLLAEHRRVGTPIIAVAYDGTGYGTDGTIWGGELLAITDPATFTRAGHLKPFALPGGEGAVRHPARIALDLMYRAGVNWEPGLAPVDALGEQGLHILAQQIPRGLGCVATTSMGRLFDAVASLLGVCQEVSYEGQAAVELEHFARGAKAVPLEFSVAAGVLDPAPVITGLVDGIRAGTDRADLAAGFHQAVISATAAAAGACAHAAGIETIGLTGGVFVNRILLDGLRKTLIGNGFEVLVHRILPCNDGGLALGQAAVAAAVRAAAVLAARSGSEQERSGVCASESPAR